jgi:invasion protein IalB
LAADAEVGGRNFAQFAGQRRPRIGRVQRRSRSTRNKGHMQFAARFAVRFLAAGGLALALAAGAQAETAKKADKEKDKDAANKPALVASYGDWSVFHSQTGKSRICYTLAQPKSRDPEDPKRDPAYAFISERPGEGVRNEVSFIMGFEIGAPGAAPDAKDKKKADAKDPKEKKDRGEVKSKKDKVELVPPTAMIGDVDFELLPKGSDLWVKNAAKESQLIDEMRKGALLKIKAGSKKGSVTEDTYSLTGFSQAIDRALKDCSGT